MIDLVAARQHFTNTDPILSTTLEAILARPNGLEIPEPMPTDQYFMRLCRSVVSQQLSVKAAQTIWERFAQLATDIEPARVASLDLLELRSVGLSNQKARYIHNFAEQIATGEVSLDHLENLDDETVITELTKLYGIGRWSAEMFLMFTLARPDVFSYGDLGLKMGFESLYGYMPTEAIVDTWRPFRTVAALTLWHAKDNRP